MKRVGIAILGLSASLFAQDNLSLWAKYKTISINTKASGANVAGNVTKFPVLVRLDSVNAPDIFATVGGAKAGGADIRFTNAAGVQKPFEIEHWDAAAKKAAIWVLADTVKGNDSVAALRIYWGNSAASAVTALSVFDTANGYVAAWHLGNATGSNPRPSSVVGAPAAQVRNALSPVAGVIGMADSLDGNGAANSSIPTGRYLDLGRAQNFANLNYAGYSNFSTGFAYSLWAAPGGTSTTATTFWRTLLLATDSTEAVTAASSRFLLMGNRNGDGQISVRAPGSVGDFNSGAGAITLNQWNHLFFTKAPGNTPLRIYVNGNLFASTNAGADIANLVRNVVWVGRSGVSTDGYFTGKVDNLSLSKTSRDSLFVKLSYETQKATANAVVLGATQSTPTGPDTSAENYATWTKKRSIWLNTGSRSLNSVKIGATVRNFPVLIRFAATDTAYTQAKAGGADLRFAKANGTTALPYQIEQWNSNGAAVWVLVDSVKANDSTQTIQMLWGNAAANSRSNGAAVFSTANGFASVWHMNDSLAQVSANGAGPTATPSAAVPAAATSANSLIGGAKVFDGATNWYQIGADSSALNLNTNLGPYTLSGWANATSCDTRIAIISKYSNSNDIAGRQYALHTSSNPTTSWRFTNGAPALNGNGDAEFAADGAETCVPGTWTYVAGTYRSAGTPTADSAVNAKLYVNGALVATATTSAITGTSLGNVSQAFIGRIATNERYMNGALDEVRVHSVVRDSNWLKLEYGNQRAGQTFALLTKPVFVGINAMASMSAMGLNVKPLSSGLQFRVNGLATGDKAVLNLLDMFGRTVYDASFSGEALTWNGMNNNGQAISAGVYVARVKIVDAKGQLRKVLEHKIPLAR